MWRLITLVLAALALTIESAHVLEMLPKLRYDMQTYSTVNSTLYQYFATVGSVYQLGSLATAAILTMLVWRRGVAFRWTLYGTICLLLAFGVWLMVVAPVNSAIASVLETAPPAAPETWMRLRSRWEYGHAAGFVLQLFGYIALVISVLVETPAKMPRKRVDSGPADDARLNPNDTIV